MSDSEPSFELSRGGEPWQMTRRNSALFTYFGRNAVHNHVFLILDEEAPATQYVWSEDGLYKPLSQFIIANHFTQHLNMEHVSRSDKAAHVADLLEGFNEVTSVPKEWLREEGQ